MANGAGGPGAGAAPEPRGCCWWFPEVEGRLGYRTSHSSGLQVIRQGCSGLLTLSLGGGFHGFHSCYQGLNIHRVGLQEE